MGADVDAQCDDIKAAVADKTQADETLKRCKECKYLMDMAVMEPLQAVHQEIGLCTVSRAAELKAYHKHHEKEFEELTSMKHQHKQRLCGHRDELQGRIQATEEILEAV